MTPNRTGDPDISLTWTGSFRPLRYVRAEHKEVILDVVPSSVTPTVINQNDTSLGETEELLSSSVSPPF